MSTDSRASAIEQWLKHRRPAADIGLPTTASDAARRFRCEVLRATMLGRDCGVRHLDDARRGRPTECAGCERGKARVRLLQIEQDGHHNNAYLVIPEAFISWLGRLPDEVIARRAMVPTSAVLRQRRDQKIPEFKGLWRQRRGPVIWDGRDFADSVHTIARALWCSASRVERARRRAGAPPSPWDRAGLGQRADGIVALRMGIPIAAVERQREAAGLPAPPPTPTGKSDEKVFVAWDSQPLGEQRDSVIARRLHVTRYAVAQARRARGLNQPERVGPRFNFDGTQIGVLPDAEIAAQLGCKPSTVTKARRDRGLPQSRWDRVGLGRQPDAVIALRMGVSVDEARARRAAVGASEPDGEQKLCHGAFVEWDSQPLGQQDDETIAARLRVTTFAVKRARTARDIAPAGTHVDWDAQPLGEDTDVAIAERLGVPAASVARQRARLGIARYIARPVLDGIDWDAQPLGELSDREIARRTGVSVVSVAAAREERGIEPWQRLTIDWDSEPLGIEPDRSIAERLGVVPDTVAAARRERHILSAPTSSLMQLRLSGHGDVARWCVSRSASDRLASQAVRVLAGEFGTLADLVDRLGPRWTAFAFSQVAEAEEWSRGHVACLGVLVGLAEMRGEVRIGPESGQGRSFQVVGAALDPLPSDASLDDVWARVRVPFVNVALLRLLTGWCGRRATDWLLRYVNSGDLERHGRRGGTKYRRRG